VTARSRTPPARRRAPHDAAPRDPAPRAALTRDRIALAALALIDDEGLEGCSMRRLGARLGVEAMALYHHFPSKGELLDAVMDHLLDETELPPRGSAPPLERLRSFMRSYRGVAIHHPRAFILLAARRFNTERQFALYEAVLEAFADLGLVAAQSARWFRLLGGFASGAGMAEVASRERVADSTPLLLERAPATIAYPHVRAIAPHLQVANLDAVFEFGTGVLFDVLAAEVTQRSAQPQCAPPPSAAGAP
jgi:AcrR family transcriptional regulator